MPFILSFYVLKTRIWALFRKMRVVLNTLRMRDLHFCRLLNNTLFFPNQDEADLNVSNNITICSDQIEQTVLTYQKPYFVT